MINSVKFYCLRVVSDFMFTLKIHAHFCCLSILTTFTSYSLINEFNKHLVLVSRHKKNTYICKVYSFSIVQSRLTSL